MQALPPDSSSNTPFQELFTMRVIWGALLVSVGMYVFVASTKTPSFVFDPAAANPQSPMEMILSGMAIGVLVLAFILPTVFLNNAKKSVTPQTSRADLARRYFVPFIIRLALLESCTIYGLVMAIQRHDVMIMLPFALLTIIGFLLSFPSEAKIRAAIQGPEKI